MASYKSAPALRLPRPSGKSLAHVPSPSNRLVIALAQIPAIVGDIAGNRDRLRKARKEAAALAPTS